MLEKEMRALALNAQLRDDCTFTCKTSSGWQHGWVAVEKHEMPAGLTHLDMLKNQTRIVIHRNKLGGQYHKHFDESMATV